MLLTESLSQCLGRPLRRAREALRACHAKRRITPIARGQRALRRNPPGGEDVIPSGWKKGIGAVGTKVSASPQPTYIVDPPPARPGQPSRAFHSRG
jgi:hypothetical protein